VFVCVCKCVGQVCWASVSGRLCASVRAFVEREGGRERERVGGGECDSVCVSCAREGERANEVPCGGYVSACCSVLQRGTVFSRGSVDEGLFFL